MSFTTQTTRGVVVRRTARKSITMNCQNPPMSGLMFNNLIPDPNDFMASHPVKTILTAGPSPLDSQSNPQNNTKRNSPQSSPPAVDHDSVVTIDFEQINMLEQNLRDFEGFLDQDNVLPQVGNVASTLRYVHLRQKRPEDVEGIIYDCQESRAFGWYLSPG